MHHPEAAPADLSDMTALPDSAMLTVAPVTLGDYELIAELGKGAMGVVYRARQKSLGRTVALKMVLNSQAQPAGLARFQQEARAAAALDHPGIVPLFDFGEVQGQPYYTMAFIDGESLTGLVKRQGPLPPRQAAEWLAQIAEAVAYAHQRGILHRDLKPDNILVDRQGHPRITDFGLARRLDEGPQLTTTGSIMGTPSYMSPEQAQGLTELTPAVDTYALGAVLHALVTGQSPFTGNSVYEVLLKVGQEPPRPLRQINSALPEGLERIVLRCLEKDPARRYASASELAADLRAWLADERAPVAQVVPAVARPRRTGALVLAGVILVALVGVGLIGWHLSQSSPGPTDPGPAAPPAGDSLVIETELLGGGDWTKASRQDFELKVTLPGIAPDENGLHLLQAKQPARIRIESAQDVYVGIWSLQGNDVVLLFPNEHERDHRVRAGVPRLVPGNEEYVIEPSAGGIEYLRVVASTVKWEPVPGKPVGPFTSYKGADRQRCDDQLRALTIVAKKKKQARVAEVVLPYQVR
jgi:predicted Ser/Thr protein kinase